MEKNIKQLKGGKQKMKAQENQSFRNLAVLLSLVLIVGIVSSAGFALADNGKNGNQKGNSNGHAITAKEIAAEINSDNSNLAAIHNENSINQDLNVLDQTASNQNLQATSFADVFHGTGWATDSSTGYFVSIMFVDKTFTSTNSTNSTSTNETFLGNGVIKLSSIPAMNLNLTSMTDNQFVFDVKSSGNVTGTLTLNRGTTLGDFSVWTGDLNLSSGKNYSINLATIDNTAKGNNLNNPGASENDTANNNSEKSNGNGNSNINGLTHGKKVGFWRKLGEFFGLQRTQNS
jgi:hypothetical protein